VYIYQLKRKNLFIIGVMRDQPSRVAFICLFFFISSYATSIGASFTSKKETNKYNFRYYKLLHEFNSGFFFNKNMVYFELSNNRGK
jgi:hypothetical protein